MDVRLGDGSMNALNFIGGHFVDAIDGQSIPNINPATGQLIGTLARSKQEDVDAAVNASKIAQQNWSALDMLERADWLDRLADGLEARKEELAQRESKDTGKPLALARRVDAQRSIDNFRFLLTLHAPKKMNCFKCKML